MPLTVVCKISPHGCNRTGALLARGSRRAAVSLKEAVWMFWRR